MKKVFTILCLVTLVAVIFPLQQASASQDKVPEILRATGYSITNLK
ncbi:hypothetical protein HNO89_000685 [Sporosarcina luteola]|nr:hypothetical protein [Sporosarcina luteola]